MFPARLSWKWIGPLRVTAGCGMKPVDASACDTMIIAVCCRNAAIATSMTPVPIRRRCEYERDRIGFIYAIAVSRTRRYGRCASTPSLSASERSSRAALGKALIRPAGMVSWGVPRRDSELRPQPIGHSAGDLCRRLLGDRKHRANVDLAKHVAVGPVGARR